MSHTETITTQDRIALNNEEVATEEEEDRIIVGIMVDEMAATIGKGEITEITATVERVIEILESPKTRSIGDVKQPKTRIIETRVRKKAAADSEVVSEVDSEAVLEAVLEADSEVV
jgi:hypothetical protein